MLILVFIGLLILFFTPPVLYFKKNMFKTFYHDILGWHVPNGEYFNNGCSICKHCGKEIMQDSQGNWF